MRKEKEDRVIVLVGPTCVGKTGVSVLLAAALETEIISADSMQVYMHMDIGTEKPTAGQRQKVPHHMIDVVEPSEGFSAGRYIDAVIPLIESLHGRGRIPLITGGTGLYIKAMTRGLFKGPGADWALREELQGLGAEELYARLLRLDPEAASSIAPNDKRRVIRALEVCIKEGRRVSERRRADTSPLPYDFVKIALFRDRVELYPMIEARVDSMMARGLVDEVRRVLEMDPSKTTMQAIGYKETAAYLRGEHSLEEAVRLIKRNTKRYAKRQFTWFRKEPDLIWVDVTGLGDDRDVLERIRPVLSGRGITIGGPKRKR